MATPQKNKPFHAPKSAQREYETSLRKIAREVGRIIEGFQEKTTGKIRNGLGGVSDLQKTLQTYADILRPWAALKGVEIAERANRQDYAAWASAAKEMSVGIKQTIRQSSVGQTMREIMQRQVHFITSLPTEAGQRVHKLVIEGLENSQRADEVAKEIRRSGEVTESRAMLIARTETTRAATALTHARAQAIGSEGYIWRTAHDGDVRESHRKMEGKFVAWNSPPTLDNLTGHAGALPNCFPGSTKVSLTNGCHYLWRHRYEGILIVIEHKRGFIELTPNHPILTIRGWIAAKDIEAGDHIIQSLSDNICALEDNKNEGQPTFDEVFAALNILVGGESKTGLLFNFHGEIPAYNVDTIRADHLLPGNGETSAFQSVCNLHFTGANRIMRKPFFGSLLHIVKSGISCALDKFLSVFLDHRLHSSHIGLGSVPAGNSVPVKNLSDRHSRTIENKGKRNLAFASNITSDDIALGKVLASVMRRASASLNLDTASAESLADNIRMNTGFFTGIDQSSATNYKSLRVINKTIRRFSDHVYTLQSVNGWYTVTDAGIIVKNCRCYPEPVIPDKFK